LLALMLKPAGLSCERVAGDKAAIFLAGRIPAE